MSESLCIRRTDDGIFVLRMTGDFYTFAPELGAMFRLAAEVCPPLLLSLNGCYGGTPAEVGELIDQIGRWAVLCGLRIGVHVAGVTGPLAVLPLLARYAYVEPSAELGGIDSAAEDDTLRAAVVDSVLPVKPHASRRVICGLMRQETMTGAEFAAAHLATLSESESDSAIRLYVDAVGKSTADSFGILRIEV